MCDLRGRAALVTGGGQGIGRGIVLELARAGSRVAIATRNLEKARVAAEEINRNGGEAITAYLDVTDASSIEKCVREVIGHFARLDILVNNAGIFQSHLGLELQDQDFNNCLDVNLTGMWRMVQAVVPYFRAQGGGKIVNIASVGGRRGVHFAPAYCASKAGVISLTQSLAAGLGAHRINVNTVCPAGVATAMQDSINLLKAQWDRRDIGEFPKPPLPDPLTAEDIGHAVVFLASDSARNITGQALNVDRGYSMN